MNEEHKKNGRPTDFHEKYYDEIVELRAAGLTIVEIARKWNVSRECVYNWVRTDSRFSDAFTRAKEAWLSWYYETGRQNLHDVQEKGSGTRFNERLYKFLGYAIAGISEKSTCAKISLDERYYDKNTSIDDKQQILDAALAQRKISTAVYESLSKTLQLSFERNEGRQILEARKYLEEKEKETNRSDSL